MKVLITEYVRIDLGFETWECSKCDQTLGDARENYKKFTRIHARDPREIHRAILDPSRYTYNFSPDPRFCVIYEFYCPNCGTLLDVEYTVPGHMPIHDIDFDIDALKAQWAKRNEISRGGVGPDMLRGSVSACGHHHGSAS